MDLTVVVGTRPEIVKMAPVILALREEDVSFSLVHTGQHYDHTLSEVFLEELGLGSPDAELDVGSGSQAKQTAEALIRLEEHFAEDPPRLILVEGDTNTVLAAALAGAKLGVDVGHVEAGLRSHDLRMPEEHNRRLTDHLSSYLYAPTDLASKNLRQEAVWGTVWVTGNTVIDASLRYLPLAEARSSVMDLVPYDRFCLVTAHRAENVDDPDTLRELVDFLRRAPLPVVYPVHPRAKTRMEEAGIYKRVRESENVLLLPPVGYFDFLVLMKHASCIVTDSGGIQEEATSPGLRKKVFVFRRSTERPEAVAAGYAKVVGTTAEGVITAMREYLDDPVPPSAPSPYGDGTSGAQIAALVQEALAEGPGPLERKGAI
ncbi:MAG: UDP-N-acetylglucosamine 2-epimerase (non-hydrolyzing) [Candidatus Thermoplasmatota archaeon]|nr:UDP-N-acetylglucosamine 2-epimerase (non-hydrolyzing) [Candidatus Thermoplasmatota archaeon]